MKKTHSASIGGTIFNVEEDAYDLLKTYLESVKTYFLSYSDSAEIVDDIEGRIAEQLASHTSPNRVVTLAHVQRIIAIMGSADQIGAGVNEVELPKPGARSRWESGVGKKLMRNPDDSIISGVSSGIAAYLGISPLPIRLLFVASFLAGGTGLIAYLLFWVFIPKAITETDRLRMRGEPVTLESVEDLIKGRNTAGTIINRTSGRRVAEILGTIFRFCIIAFAIFIGACMAFAFLYAILAFVWMLIFELLASAGATIGNSHQPPGIVRYPLIVTAFLSTVIPAVLVIVSALSITRRKAILSGRGWVVIVSFWLACTIVSGVLMARYAPEQMQQWENDCYIDAPPGVRCFKLEL